jgi:isopenicillin-N N-acyltransferase-like protein
MFDLPKVFAVGTPLELGRGQGEAQRTAIQGFVAQRLSALSAYLAERGESARYAEFVAVGRACLEAATAFDETGVLEHQGIAEGANVDPALLYATTNMTDVRDVLVLPSSPDREGCTSLLLPPEKTRERLILAGQTWDLNPTDLDFVVAVNRRPHEGPETWSITCAGALSLVGMNADGVAVGTTNIKTRASRVGVGYLSILHRAIRSRTLSEALRVIRSAPRAAAHTYWAVDERAGSELECDPETVQERPLGDLPIVQTNHCQAPELSRREGEVASESSRKRLARAERSLSTGAHDIDSLRALFADRSDGVDSINRYSEDEQGTTTNACVLCVPSRRELWACRGPSDRGSWQRLSFGASA